MKVEDRGGFPWQRPAKQLPRDGISLRATARAEEKDLRKNKN